MTAEGAPMSQRLGRLVLSRSLLIWSLLDDLRDKIGTGYRSQLQHRRQEFQLHAA
jgi:hypothetical protein